MQRFDVLIVGAGPAGSTAAILLAQAGWSVAIVERKAFPRTKVCGEYLSATNWVLFERLGLLDALATYAGPPVREVGILMGAQKLRAVLPAVSDEERAFGCAIPRQHLDSLLLEKVRDAGAVVFQPANCVALHRSLTGHRAEIALPDDATSVELESRWLIAAHGSWGASTLPTYPARLAPRGGDLFGFKAVFHSHELDSGLMPLVGFPGGYGGLIHLPGGAVGFSYCVRRDCLQRLERSTHGAAGDAVLEYILKATPALRRVLSAAGREAPWLSAGPIRPGIRRQLSHEALLVGNAAGEAHPVVAEGISMAMQSSWLLARALGDKSSRSAVSQSAVAAEYTAAWRRSFVPRIRAAALIAQWAMRPNAARAVLPLLRGYPSLLTWGARLSGKSTVVVTAS